MPQSSNHLRSFGSYLQSDVFCGYALTSFALSSIGRLTRATVEGRFLHQAPSRVAAAYLFHLCQNPFMDGNKRVAAAAEFSFLYLNGWELRADQESFRDLVFGIAGGKVKKAAAAAFLKKNSKTIA